MLISPAPSTICAPAPPPRSGQWRLDLFPLAETMPANDASADAPAPSTQGLPSSGFEIRSRLGETMPALQRRALYLSRNRAEADDLVHDTVERALRFASGYQSGTNLKAWLLQIMYTVFASRCRKSQRERAAHLALSNDPNAWGHSMSDAADRGTMLDGFLGKLRALPPPYAEVLWLVDYHDYAYADAAEALGIPLGTVMSRLHRARRMMRTALDAKTSLG